ncbi:MAG TPA: bifunctional glutamate N-acetyltransferase/amino-acid acetyltransferase ArgJ [Kofleriaceae bacterium]|nr:bifunctional glutamate N-acetyltransferase/amino-acid acetyltransferase ArgJ [Kofleriaceae bacterium]
MSCPGFRFSGVAAGIKKKGGPDVGLIAADAPASVAAVFTGNRVKAAPVLLSAAALRAAKGKLRGVVVNSGNANACTGKQGVADAKAMAAAAAAVMGAKPGQMLVASTGVIGQALPMDRVDTGIAAAGAVLRPGGWDDFAAAILTTDKRPKTARCTVRLGRENVTILGCTKGAGMIAPNMATTLTFIATDAVITPPLLAKATRAAVAPTYNAIAVDGDTSTNDTLAVLASGATGAAVGGKALAAFTEALTDLCHDLATQLMRDGEGVHHVVTVEVRGAATEKAALAVARRIATSPLVKTAIAGGDPNWGRILCAAGNAGVPFDPTKVALAFAGVPVVAKGTLVAGYDETRAAAVMREAAYTMTLDLGGGRASARFLACDLSHEYVSINADYRS